MGRLNLKNGSPEQRAGLKAERLAILYLFLHGYRLLEHNYRIGHHEIDLIVRKGNNIAFVEVKSGYDRDGISPIAKVDRRKRNNIIPASKYYIAKCGLDRVVFRYDVIVVDTKKLKIVHLENAFYAS